ncbi:MULTISPECIES: hypothetical protein [Bacillati]|uniref:Uncharacterized protein n=2 Tax=Bacillati TaxID=1783272 RepID=A8SI93_9FIRM|nr:MULTISPECIES: hypothetical protein [Terrabacteria group]EDP24823.1 hypothetical protein PEPMIC_00045 [Parvimonas micra ATCC 33270]EEG69860.1 hypothetical protein BIFPSEUDO_04512 [Bifidobacterium pseudocatenulatum DSM 20438 = JCM 1200 = LMG 10505]
MIEHPDITRTIRMGYPEREQKHCGFDFFGNECFEGEEILVLDDEFFVKQELSNDAISILRYFGASSKIAK